MKKLLTHLLLLSLVLVPLFACQPADNGDAEEAMEEAAESVEEAAEEMGDQGGEAMEEGMEEAGEAMEETMDEGEEAAEETTEDMGGDNGGA